MGDHWGKAENVLDFLGCNVLSLRKLEDVLGPVDDLDGAILKDTHYITCLEPAIGIESFSRLLRILVVAGEHHGTLDEKLTLRVRFVIDGVVHLWQTLESELGAADWATNMARNLVILIHDGAASTRLSETVALKDRTAEADLEEVNDLFVDGGRASDHQANTASKHGGCLAE